MYSQFFGLKREPFSIAPDPRFLFMSERHREALAHLLYGLDGGGGFVLLSGEIGAGKTTVCRCFLERIPKRCNVAYIFNPKLTVIELLQSVCEEFHIPLPDAAARRAAGPATVKEYLDPINEFLLRTHAVGQNNVLIIDEAQNLSADVLEQLRLLTNLETNERKLLQIILIGQPELRDMLARPELEQLAQRVIARFHLGALSEAETAQYIRHRLTVAGLRGALPFDASARERIHQLSRGVPRRINLLCDRALLGAYSGGTTKVDRAIVDQAAKEVFGRADAGTAARFGYRSAALVGLGLVAGAALFGVATLAYNGALDSPGPRPMLPAGAVLSAAPASAVAAASAASTSALALAPVVAAFDLQRDFDSLLRNEADAWRELAPAWNLSLGDGDPCPAAQGQQVHCYRNKTNLALIRQLGRPGILTLRGDLNDLSNNSGNSSGNVGNRPAYALLTGLTGLTATLRAGGVSHTVPLLALAAVWRGEFATFWRAPSAYRSTVADGSSGAVVDALAVQLARSRGQPGPTQPVVFDAAFKARLTEFQLAQGLKPDGLAGPTTFMQLNRATGVDEPRLQSDPPAQPQN